MKETQKSIFYMAADNKAAAASAPFVEQLVQKGYEVLYLTEPIDEVSGHGICLCAGNQPTVCRSVRCTSRSPSTR
jgi:HSP90 family molecular chaperone